MRPEDERGETLVKLFQGPADGWEFTSDQSLPSTLQLPYDTGAVLTLSEVVDGPAAPGVPTVSYHLVHIEPSENILPAEAHYLYEVPDAN